MAYGVVISKHRGMVNTPNHGIVLDFSTGLSYPFGRPDAEVGTVPTEWNVKVHDIVTFTIVNGEATAVTLYKKHADDIVYYKPL